MKIKCIASMYKELLAAKSTFEQMAEKGVVKAQREAAKAKVEVFNWLLFQFDFQQLNADLKELQNIADKWTDEKTQKQLYLGRCVEIFFEKYPFFESSCAEDLDYNTSDETHSVCFESIDEFIEWGKQQGVE